MPESAENIRKDRLHFAGPGRLGRYPFIPPKQHQHMFRSRSAFKHILSGVSPESAGRFKKAAATPVMKALKHLKTVRGHRSPVYCLTIDRVGRLAVTGADDTIIKVCALTCLQIKSMLKHLKHCRDSIADSQCLTTIT